MKRFFIALTSLSILAASFLANAQDAQTHATAAKQSQFVEITSGFVNVFETLDPKSPILGQAKRGEFYPLLSDGTGWYEIQINDKQGWIEKSSGKISAKPTTVFGVMNLSTFITLVVLIVVLIGGMVFLKMRQQQVTAGQ